mmetsp:Transcript_3330/g.10227  ORF Transcript_3330/g.10227 Transcript_3330/m.10227 type:complete len:228 (-) Transcript_3330:703-1386(-)
MASRGDSWGLTQSANASRSPSDDCSIVEAWRTISTDVVAPASVELSSDGVRMRAMADRALAAAERCSGSIWSSASRSRCSTSIFATASGVFSFLSLSAGSKAASSRSTPSSKFRKISRPHFDDTTFRQSSLACNTCILLMVSCASHGRTILQTRPNAPGAFRMKHTPIRSQKWSWSSRATSLMMAIKSLVACRVMLMSPTSISTARVEAAGKSNEPSSPLLREMRRI